jgi:hypothetical protein
MAIGDLSFSPCHGTLPKSRLVFNGILAEGCPFFVRRKSKEEDFCLQHDRQATMLSVSRSSFPDRLLLRQADYAVMEIQCLDDNAVLAPEMWSDDELGMLDKPQERKVGPEEALATLAEMQPYMASGSRFKLGLNGMSWMP